MIIQRVTRTGPGPNDVKIEDIPPEDYFVDCSAGRAKVWLRTQDGWSLSMETPAP